MTYDGVLTAPATLARLERLVALARRAPPECARLLRRRGRGLEAGSRRDYAPGDDLRRVDWAAYARLERLLTWVPEELLEPRLELIVDGSGSMGAGEPDPGLRARLVVASLAAAAVAREVRVAVWWSAAAPRRKAVSRPGELVALLRFLGQPTPAAGSHLVSTARRAAEGAQGRGSAVLVTDGLDPACVPAAAQLGRRGFDPLVVVVEPRAELSPGAATDALAAGWVEVVDAETGARRRVAVSPRGLEEALGRRRAATAALCRALAERGIAATVLGSTSPFEAVAVELLRGRRRIPSRTGPR